MTKESKSEGLCNVHALSQASLLGVAKAYLKEYVLTQKKIDELFIKQGMLGNIKPGKIAKKLNKYLSYMGHCNTMCSESNKVYRTIFGEEMNIEEMTADAVKKYYPQLDVVNKKRAFAKHMKDKAKQAEAGSIHDFPGSENIPDDLKDFAGILHQAMVASGRGDCKMSFVDVATGNTYDFNGGVDEAHIPANTAEVQEMMTDNVIKHAEEEAAGKAKPSSHSKKEQKPN